MASPPFIVFDVPKDPAVLQALGVVAVRQGHLDRMLRMTIKTLAEVTPREAVDATIRESSSSLRGRVRKFAKERLGEGAPLIKLQALLERANRATGRRNEWIHNVCAREIDETEPQLLADDHSLRPFPTVAELNDLATELAAIAGELNEARLEGFIRKAMDEKKRAAVGK